MKTIAEDLENLSAELSWILKNGEYYLVCDNCGKRIRFEEWDEAVKYKKTHGWKSRKQSDEWLDICKECLE